MNGAANGLVGKRSRSPRAGSGSSGSEAEVGLDMDEEAEAQRILLESRRRREAICAKHNAVSAASGAHQPAPVVSVTGTSVVAPIAPAPANADATILTSTDQLTAPTVAGLPGVSMFDDVEDSSELMEKEDALSDMRKVAQLRAAGTSNVATNAAAVSSAAESLLANEEHPTLIDNWDDHEGYYKVRVGEVLADRYQVLGNRGRGVFSTVLYCKDTKAVDAGIAELDDEATAAAAADGKITTAAAPITVGSSGAIVRTHAALATGTSSFVAVKMIRSNDTMRRAGMKELELLRAIATADPEGRYHCVRLLHNFEHRNHLCLVFEPLHMNLKEVQNKYGKGIGISIEAVRSYAKQMLLALALLAKLHIIHADIKLHNILSNDRYNVIKLADFGSAFRENDPDNEPTPYLVSRFYRAPEIIMGYIHTTALDVWSVACCLYELYTGHPLFPGEDNNDMVWRFQTLRGRFPHKMIRNHLRHCEGLGIDAHFDQELRFRRHIIDPVTKKPAVRVVDVTSPADDLGAMLLAKRAHDDDKKMVNNLKDLLEKMLVVDPAKRVSVKDALSHPFLRNKAAHAQPSKA